MGVHPSEQNDHACDDSDDEDNPVGDGDELGVVVGVGAHDPEPFRGVLPDEINLARATDKWGFERDSPLNHVILILRDGAPERGIALGVMGSLRSPAERV